MATTLYRTEDGEVFENKEDADFHEEILSIKKGLAKQVCVFQGASHEDIADQIVSNRKEIMALLRRLYEACR